MNCRFLHGLKSSIHNRNRVEGSICKQYLRKETSIFCKYFFPDQHNDRPSRNADDVEQSVQRASIFGHPGRPSGQSSTRQLQKSELNAAHLHVLLNSPEVKPILQ